MKKRVKKGNKKLIISIIIIAIVVIAGFLIWNYAIAEKPLFSPDCSPCEELWPSQCGGFSDLNSIHKCDICITHSLAEFYGYGKNGGWYSMGSIAKIAYEKDLVSSALAISSIYDNRKCGNIPSCPPCQIALAGQCIAVKDGTTTYVFDGRTDCQGECEICKGGKCVVKTRGDEGYCQPNGFFESVEVCVAKPNIREMKTDYCEGNQLFFDKKCTDKGGKLYGTKYDWTFLNDCYALGQVCREKIYWGVRTAWCEYECLNHDGCKQDEFCRIDIHRCVLGKCKTKILPFPDKICTGLDRNGCALYPDRCEWVEA